MARLDFIDGIRRRPYNLRGRHGSFQEQPWPLKEKTLHRIILISVVLLVFGSHGRAFGAGVAWLSIDGAVTPIVADYLTENLRKAAERSDRLVVIAVDTPGGLESSMRKIVKEILASPVPVVVFVTPSGARAASAGAIIGLSADILAMSPGTNIGAAHPVALGQKSDKVMEEKAVNDSVAFAEGVARQRGRNEEVARRMVRQSVSLSVEAALSQRVADLVAPDRVRLLGMLEGRTVSREGREIRLELQGVPVTEYGMDTRQKILNVISDPNIAYMLMMLGMMGLFFELSNPGAILPGVVGAISLLLAFFAFQTLPVNYAGVLLILFAIILYIAEIKVVSHGMLAVGGTVAMLLGSLLLFESPGSYLRLSLKVIIPTVAVTLLFFTVIVSKAVRAQRRKPVTGEEGMVGMAGVADSGLDPEGKVLVRGEYWDAWSDRPVAKGEKITVVAVDGMRLKVERAGEH